MYTYNYDKHSEEDLTGQWLKHHDYNNNQNVTQGLEYADCIFFGVWH